MRRGGSRQLHSGEPPPVPSGYCAIRGVARGAAVLLGPLSAAVYLDDGIEAATALPPQLSASLQDLEPTLSANARWLAYNSSGGNAPRLCRFFSAGAVSEESEPARWAMRKLVYFVACTVDGFIADERGGLDFFPTQGEHLPYIVAEYPETIPAHLREALGVRGDNRHFDTVLMGRHTYEVGSAIGITSPYPHLRQYLVSTTVAMSPSGDLRLVSTDPMGLVRQLKQESGLDIWLCGGARLAGVLSDALDELVVKINPVVLGDGIPLFRDARGPVRLSLVDHRTFTGGVAIHRYAVAA